MATVKIYYVGRKDLERAFHDKTGIEWTPGAAHDVDATIASKLLQHPDVFSTEPGAVVEGYPVVGNLTGLSIGGTITASTTLNEHTLDVLGGYLEAQTDLAGWNALTEAERAAFIVKATGPDIDDAPATLTAEYLETLDRDALVALAAGRKVKHHVSAGAPKIRSALLAAQA